ncbi:MAG: bifunctional 4-hydroxy-2-oxoglutarate aldolase/2-dehydro-3-deoxy-phosphogluconate aldolase [Arthrobacter sp.]|uniref:bifunctional 4-hydroxy-2-oxoglutarate aldolase/2-dehydro-3-deoxy-phosphogluconate aldolase n=1 Tax=Arthrobacter sp. TaxID=1667 RepID=UPI0034741C09
MIPAHEAAFATLSRVGIVPVVVVDDPARSSDLADALVAGGLPIAEITFRTPGAEAALRTFADRPDMLAGAGTVLTADQVDLAAEAGARFIVSPGFSTAVVRRAQELGLPVLPGVASASDLQAAVAEGIERVKLFPANRLGGPDMIASLSEPFPGMGFLPSGGVGPGNAAAYLAQPSVFALGGSWMVRRDLVAAGDLAAVARLSAEAVALVASLRAGAGTGASA